MVETLDEALSLSGQWRFQAGDDPAWSDPAYDDSSWDELRVPGGWGRQGYRDHSGVAWYRLEVDLSRALAAGREDVQVGVHVGEVTSSYELYAGGKRIGGVGALPPEPRMEYDRHRIYSLPMASIDSNGRVVLAMRVWRSSISRTHEGGPTRGPFLIGRLEQLNTRALLDGLPYLALVAIFAAAGLYHVRLYAEHRSLVEHFWFGVLALDIAAYTLLRTQWKYGLSSDFMLLKNLEYAAIYMLPAIGIQHIATARMGEGLRPRCRETRGRRGRRWRAIRKPRSVTLPRDLASETRDRLSRGSPYPPHGHESLIWNLLAVFRKRVSYNQACP